MTEKEIHLLLSDLYLFFLKRMPDQNGINFYTKEIQRGIELGEIIKRFITCEEYVNMLVARESDTVASDRIPFGSTLHDLKARINTLVRRLSPELTVLNGPFKGLKYPSSNINEYTILPKIYGSYEDHLHFLITKLIHAPYKDILNIGCAEGYYAVGFALRMPDSIIHCFDVSDSNLDFCRQMAWLNSVNNVVIHGPCSVEIIEQRKFIKPALIICDCEGCELDIFTQKVIDNLVGVDVLVELHDLYNPLITAELVTRFQYTHLVKFINNQKIPCNHSKDLELFSEEERNLIVCEHRGGIMKNVFMQWAYFSSDNQR